ncbi:MAG: RHS repeat-associated core domain-containing protein, partial [Byssovorax sp.]
VIKTGVRFQYEYEANTGRCKKTWGPKGLYAIELRTDKAAKTTHVDGEEPRIITWNEQGLATREALPDGTILEESAYDEDGLLIAKVNGAGEGEQSWYDERGNRVQTVDAAGNTTSTEYEDDLPRKLVTPDGLVTEYFYDARGALTVVATPSGQRYSLTYDDRGRMTGLADAAGLIQGFEHDQQHNLIAEIDARGARTVYSHDTMGRPVSRTDALGRVTRLSYDRLGRRLAVRLPDGSMTQSAYDARGRVLRSTDQLGHVTSYEYGGMGVLSRLIQPDGRAWSFKHTSKERVQEIKNPRGEAYTFSYDEVGRAISETSFDGRTIEYHYAASGRVDRIGYPDGTSRAFAYDRLGKLIHDTAPDGKVTCERDRLGRLVGATLEEQGHQIVTRFQLDALGRVVCEAQGDRRIDLAYDAWGRRSERRLPNGSTRYTYDAADALVGVEHEGQKLVFERDALGREMRRGDSRGQVSIQQTYDVMDRLIEQRVAAVSPGGGIPAILVQRQYGYDAAGKVKRIDDGRWGGTSYTYDEADRLLDARRESQREAFRYDAAGALVSLLEGLDPPKRAGWEIAPGNTLTRTEEAKYSYDERGRRIARLDLKARDSRGEGAVTRYTWDSSDHLREVELPEGTRIRMTYDAFGRRIRKAIVLPDGTVARTVEFLWDGDTIAADFDSVRGPRGFVHAPGTQLPLLQAEQGKVFTYVNDHLGTAKELIDPTGQVAWSAAHSAWGELQDSYIAPALATDQKRRIESPFRMLGQFADEETGLHSTRYRFFDPEVGRWCSPDPLGLLGGNDLFGFEGSPTVEVDPLGLAGKKGSPHGGGGGGGTAPPNMSPPGAGRQGAFNEAKRRSGIPTSQQPSAVRPNTDRRGAPQPGRQYDFNVATPGGGTKTVTIRDDAGGHDFGPGDPQNRGPHFNDEEGNHYDY